MFFRDVIGHEAALSRLRASFSGGRLPHALLLSGKRGVGKSLIARSLVAARFCEAGGDEACGACGSCRAFAHGNHPDFEWVRREPGKRDIGIGQMRALMDVLHRKSQQGGGRAAIIDDAERMTVEAQNAFLKTLEEPPRDVLLVLVTAVVERLLPTVRSRCVRYTFGALDGPEMTRYLEGASLPSGRVPALSLAMGSPGRLRVLATAGVREAIDSIVLFLTESRGVSSFTVAAELISRAAEDAPEEDEDARERARDRLLLFVRLLACALRDLHVLALGVDGAPLFHADRRDRLEAAARSGLLDPDGLSDALRWCDQAEADLYRNVDPTLALEDALERIGGAVRPRDA